MWPCTHMVQLAFLDLMLTHGEDSAPHSNLPQIVCNALVLLVALLPRASTPKDWVPSLHVVMILLDKCPGVRPMGVGEVPWRIIAKAILKIVGNDVEEAAGPLQLCTGQDGGCEAAVHAMWTIFQTPETAVVFIVYANNAFNSLNRNAFLHNTTSYALC